MESASVFHLTRTNLYHLRDFSNYALTSKTLLVLSNTTPSTMENSSRASFCSRTSRSSCKLNPLSRHNYGEPKNRHQSLVGLRTYYAFGARSSSVCAPSKLSSITAFNYERINAISSVSDQLSYTTNFPRSSTLSSVGNTRSYISATGWPKLYRHSFINNTISNSVNFSRLPRTHFSPLSFQGEQGSSTDLPVNSHLPRLNMELKVKGNDLEIDQKIKTIQNPPTTSNHILEEESILLKSHLEKRTAPSSGNEDFSLHQEVADKQTEPIKDNSEETLLLLQRNKILEMEVQRLKVQLQDKERSENELKRRLLESGVEIKAWKAKYEQRQAKMIEIREPSNVEFSKDLISQLDSAAEKLSRFNAVKDLKMLQSEMEIALKEICAK